MTREKDGYILITISDNGVGRAMAEKLKEQKVLKRKSIGIDITRERLANFSRDYQNSFEVDIVDRYDEGGQPAGTTIKLHVPTV